MIETKTACLLATTCAALPASIHVSTTPLAVLGNLRVVDADTGEPIAKVISADVDAGKLSRFAIDEHGNMVRADNSYQIVDEDRAVRIEWIDPPVVPASATSGAG